MHTITENSVGIHASSILLLVFTHYDDVYSYALITRILVFKLVNHAYKSVSFLAAAFQLYWKEVMKHMCG